MTQEQEEQVRRYPIGGVLAIKWLKDTRGWSLKQSKDYYNNYLKKNGSMTYDFVFKDRPIPDEILKNIFPYNLDVSIELDE
ncbi:MAG: hypothetical protein HRT61_02910 [Ekhidna sp.]|nr:hypothetical protein [Ekhidna sp.]